MTILAISSLQGMNNAIIRSVAMGFEHTLKIGFKTKLKWGLLGSIASIGVAVYFWLQGNIEFAISFLIIAFFLPLMKGSEIYQSYLSGKKLFDKKVNYTTLTQILSTIFLVITLFLTKSLIILVLVYFLSYSLLRTFFLIRVIKKYPPNQKHDSKTIAYGKHLSLMQVLTIISQEIDKILLFSFVGPIKLAIYSFATLPIQHIRSPLQTIQELAFPKFASQSKEKIKKTLPKKLLKALFFIIPIIIIYIIIAPYVYKIFFPQYTDAIFYSRLFSLALLVFPTSMMAIALQAKMKTKELYKINIIQPIILIAFLSILTPLYGILGVILARLSSHVFYFLLVFFFFKKM